MNDPQNDGTEQPQEEQPQSSETQEAENTTDQPRPSDAVPVDYNPEGTLREAEEESPAQNAPEGQQQAEQTDQQVTPEAPQQDSQPNNG